MHWQFTAVTLATSYPGFTQAFVAVNHAVKLNRPVHKPTLASSSSAAVCSRGAARRVPVRMAAAAIVGKGRIGNALFDMGSGDDTLIGRGDEIPDGEGPIYVCTRNDDLEDVIARTPEARRKDLVFVQNGVLGPLLDKHGLGRNTQALIYFAVSKKGEAPADGVTDVNPEGLTSACGIWANDFKGRLAGGGLTCHVLSEDRYTARMYEKHIWICAFMACGAFHKCNIGEVEAKHSDEVRAVIDEMQKAISNEYGVTFEDGVHDRLCAYARSVAYYPAAIKEFSWRNGFFWDISEKARKEGKADPCPLHSKLLLGVVALNLEPVVANEG